MSVGMNRVNFLLLSTLTSRKLYSGICSPLSGYKSKNEVPTILIMQLSGIFCFLRLVTWNNDGLSLKDTENLYKKPTTDPQACEG